MIVMHQCTGIPGQIKQHPLVIVQAQAGYYLRGQHWGLSLRACMQCPSFDIWCIWCIWCKLRHARYWRMSEHDISCLCSDSIFTNRLGWLAQQRETGTSQHSLVAYPMGVCEILASRGKHAWRSSQLQGQLQVLLAQANQAVVSILPGGMLRQHLLALHSLLQLQSLQCGQSAPR